MSNKLNYILLSILVLCIFFACYISFNVKPTERHFHNRFLNIKSTQIEDKPYKRVTKTNNPNNDILQVKPEIPKDGYFTCSRCKTSYSAANVSFGPTGLRVQCCVCKKIWFQALEKLSTLGTHAVLTNITYNINENGKMVTHNRFRKVPIYVGNLPYNYSESQVIDLFSDYGVVSVSMAKDKDGTFKGFSFVDVIIFNINFHNINRNIYLYY